MEGQYEIAELWVEVDGEIRKIQIRPTDLMDVVSVGFLNYMDGYVFKRLFESLLFISCGSVLILHPLSIYVILL